MTASVKSVAAGLLLASALVGFAMAYALRLAAEPEPAPAKPVRLRLPADAAPVPSAVPTETTSPAPTSSRPAAKTSKPTPKREKQGGGHDDGRLVTAGGTLDGALDVSALAGVTPRQSAQADGGLIHGVDPDKRLGETPQNLPEIGHGAPPLTPKGLDALIPLFAGGTQTNLNISQTNRSP